jgi:uncharacterized protein YyaL (SSP411 family)
MRTHFPDEKDRQWLRRSLGLRVETNRQMIPVLTSPSVVTDPRLPEMIRRLRSIPAPQPEFAGLQQLDTNAYVLARMLETARILGDQARLNRLLDRCDALEEYRAGDDVVHGLKTNDRGHAYLGDYLAYSDMALQLYLATGQTEAFRRGLRVLNRARFLFAGRVPGEYTLAQRRLSPLWPRDTDVPEIVDGIIDSASSRMIRLCHAYGRLLQRDAERGGVADPAAAELKQAALTSVQLYSGIVNRMGEYGAGYLSASLEVIDNAFLVVVGPDAQARADRLFRMSPGRLVAVASEEVHRDLLDRPVGIYRIVDGRIEGPLSESEALAKTSPWLSSSPNG